MAPANSTWSEIQNDTGNNTQSNSSAGSAAFNVSATFNFALADDFVVLVGTGWQITSMDFFAYQTGYTGTTCPINRVHVGIYNSDPSLPGAVSVFGDQTTNRFVSGTSTSTYIIFNSLVPDTFNAPATTRLIWKVNASTPVTLPAGTG